MPRHKAATKQLPTLNRKSDNEAQRSWRKRNTPSEAVRLPRGFDPFEIAAGCSTQRLQSIVYKTQAHIVPKQVDGVKGALEFQIWGSPSQCAAAVHEIKAWVEEQVPKRSTTRRSKESFPRTQTYIEGKQPEILKKLKIEERRQKYRQQRPSGGNSFVSVYVLKWGATDWSLEDVLGPSLEALDPIRMDCLCHIDILRTNSNIAGEPCFIIAGNKEKRVKIAVERLQNIDKHIIAHKFEHSKFFLVKPTDLSAVDNNRHSIQLQEYFKPMYLFKKDHIEDQMVSGITMALNREKSGKNNHLNKDELFPWSIEDTEFGSVSFGAKHGKHHIQQYLDLWLTSTLEYLPYFSGYLKMRASLGACVFTNYKKAENGIYDLQTFEEMLGERNTQENEMDAYFTNE
jgi:hypothetical protein